MVLNSWEDWKKAINCFDLRNTWNFWRNEREITQLQISKYNRAYAHDVMAALLVFQNIETEAMLVSQTNPVEVQLFYSVSTFFCSNKFAWQLASWEKTLT